MEAKLGNYVRTEKHQYLGRVCAKYHSFKNVSENEAWFKLQSLNKGTKSQNWYGILCKDEGSICVPEEQIQEIVKPFKLNNVWENNYFDN